MIGYCSKCKDQVEMANVFTDQLPNGRLVHKGRCAVCGDPVWKTVRDEEILVTKSGKHIPDTIYIGKNTPKALKQLQEKHEEMSGEKLNIVFFYSSDTKTLKQVKEEAGIYEKETFITR